MTDEAAAPSKKRRTAAEMKAFYLGLAKEAEEREKGDVLRLVSDAHDTMAEAATLEASKAHAPAFAQVMNAQKALISAFTPPPKK